MNDYTQPEALRLAEILDCGEANERGQRYAAAELRRLHEVEIAYEEWIDKSEWVQVTAQAQELGMHRADVLKDRIDRLYEVNQVLMKAIAKGLDLPFDNEIAWFEWRDSAEAALAKATGESNA